MINIFFKIKSFLWVHHQFVIRYRLAVKMKWLLIINLFLIWLNLTVKKQATNQIFRKVEILVN